MIPSARRSAGRDFGQHAARPVSAYDPAGRRRPRHRPQSVERAGQSRRLLLGLHHRRGHHARGHHHQGLQPLQRRRQLHPRRDLTVQVELLPSSCAEGTWFAHGQVNRNGMPTTWWPRQQCQYPSDRSAPTGSQRFRFTPPVDMGACIGWQALDLPIAPATQATTSPTCRRGLAGLLPWSPSWRLMPSGCTPGRVATHLPVRHGSMPAQRDGARRYLMVAWAGESGGAADQ